MRVKEKKDRMIKRGWSEEVRRERWDRDIIGCGSRKEIFDDKRKF